MFVICERGMDRIGSIDASWHNTFMSAPEKPSVIWPISLIWFVVKLARSFLSKLMRICSRAACSGSGMYNRLTKRRRAASSSSCGRLVAPTIRMRSFSPVAAPSSWTRNSVWKIKHGKCVENSLQAADRRGNCVKLLWFVGSFHAPIPIAGTATNRFRRWKSPPVDERRPPRTMREPFSHLRRPISMSATMRLYWRMLSLIATQCTCRWVFCLCLVVQRAKCHAVVDADQ